MQKCWKYRKIYVLWSKQSYNWIRCADSSILEHIHLIMIFDKCLQFPLLSSIQSLELLWMEIIPLQLMSWWRCMLKVVMAALFAWFVERSSSLAWSDTCAKFTIYLAIAIIVQPVTSSTKIDQLCTTTSVGNMRNWKMWIWIVLLLRSDNIKPSWLKINIMYAEWLEKYIFL